MLKPNELNNIIYKLIKQHRVHTSGERHQYVYHVSKPVPTAVETETPIKELLLDRLAIIPSTTQELQTHFSNHKKHSNIIDALDELEADKHISYFCGVYRKNTKTEAAKLQNQQAKLQNQQAKQYAELQITESDISTADKLCKIVRSAALIEVLFLLGIITLLALIYFK